ncbi:MAG: hypothetical protein IAG13_19135, partial [Deltaproteobacteria bacterium]|nr:hypothetical protein [Nannocystaceae bacterium]
MARRVARALRRAWLAPWTGRALLSLASACGTPDAPANTANTVDADRTATSAAEQVVDPRVALA